MRSFIAAVMLFALLEACSAGPMATPDSGMEPDAGDVLTNTVELDVPVPASGRVYVNLATAAVVTPTGDPIKSREWDLAFEGFDVFTNSGVSGQGSGGGFGPLDPVSFLADSAPAVPFISVDKAGGAFFSWYAYDGMSHLLYSRFHVYGVKRGAQLWKVQVLSYYGLVMGAPTSALFQLRYADVTSGVGPTQMLQVDGTAGGVSAPMSATSGCLTLSSGTVTQLTVAAAGASMDWDLCFRRDAVSVNSEAGGPGSVGAVDLQSAQTAGESLNDVEARTAASEQAQFDAVNSASFNGASFRGDHVVSAFETGRWLDTTQSPPVPVDQAWLVVEASGLHKFLVAFTFRGATAASPGTVVMHIKPVSG
jgi:hypothetical protein